MTYQELKEEILRKKTTDKLSKNQVIILEQQIFKDLLKENAICVKCRRKDGLTLDHIVPKVLLEHFGIRPEYEIVEGNYQILCKICNQFKSGRLDFSTRKTKDVLLKLLERV